MSKSTIRKKVECLKGWSPFSLKMLIKNKK
jgi:hypothetical protein